MKVFISSLIGGFEPFRDAVAGAIRTLRHEPVMAEDFRPGPTSPQVACLSGVRSSDLVILILGERYGAKQASGLSATHEEYEDAKSHKPVVVFVQKGIARDADQEAFVSEVQGWEGGHWRGEFSDAMELREKAILALHDHEMATAAGPVDKSAIMAKATSLAERRERQQEYNATLTVAIAGGPLQAILRPAQIEDASLKKALHKAAIFGEAPVFDSERGVTPRIEGNALRLMQDRHAAIALDEEGSVVVESVVERDSMMMVLTEETVQSQIAISLAYGAWVLEHVDPTQRLTHCAIGVAISGGTHLTWRTQRENELSPNSVAVNMFPRERKPVVMDRSRPALRLDRTRLVEDITVLLRRQWTARQ